MAEGGPGRSRNFWGSRYGPRPWETRVCKFYIQGNCFYGENCRFRHVNTSHRGMHEDFTCNRHDRNDSWGHSNALRERKPQQASGGSVTEPNLPSGASTGSSLEDRVHAPEFVPSAQEAHSERANSPSKTSNETGDEASNSSHNSQGGISHGLKCHACNETSSDPNNEERTNHVSGCTKKYEKDTNVSVAIQRSKDKACGICFEVIMEKSDGGRKFGILPNCNHCFCLVCIRKWRRANDFDNEITRACPECRVSSDFVCPSFYWVETKEDKEKLITDYKGALREKNCKYFQTRRGRCPFGDKCFYKHTCTPGTQTSARRFRQRRRSVDIAVSRLLYLWDFLALERECDLSFDLEDFSIMSDSDDSHYGLSFSADSSD